MKFFEVFFITGLISILICQSGAQECLRTEQGDDTEPPFEDNNNSPTLPARSQVITPTYRFRCCGEIEEWRTFVSRSNGRYNVTFQVWRPTASHIPNCYTFVGENKFTNIDPNGNEIIVTIPSQDRIYFQENDVVGFDITRIGGNGGIQLLVNNDEYSNDVIWYNTFSANDPVSGYPKSCPYCIGAGKVLPTLTTAAPVFSAQLSTTSCSSSQPLLSTIPSSCQPSSSLVHMTTIEQTTVEIVMENTELISPTSTFSPATTTNVATADISMMSTKLFINVLQQTPSSTPSPNNTPTIRPAPIDLFLTTGANLEFSNKDRSSNAWVIAAVIAVLIIMIITVLVVVIFVMVIMGTKQKKKSGLANPGYGDNEVIGHIYQTVDDKPVPSPQRNCSKSGDAMDSDGIYSLYSPPPVPGTRTENLSAYDKEKGYDVVKEEYPAIPERGKTSDHVENEYAYVAPSEISQNLTSSIQKSSGLAVPSQEQRQANDFSDDRKYGQLNFFEKESIYWVPAKSTEELYDQLSSRKYREIPRKQVTILEHLGSGQFGSVSKGLWKVTGKSLLMAVKKLKPSASSTTRVKLLQEAAIIGQFHHINIVQLYGLMTIGEPLAMCIEFMKNGDLEGFLTAFNVKRDSPPNNHKDIQYYFIQAAIDIASGMNYLSGKGFVHRDLATRNILLSDTMTCKIGDFGMARDLVDDTYYTASDRRAIPVKWTAPEAIFYKKYSTDSDVWSFGMVLFEMWSVGKIPFPLTEVRKVPELMKIGYCQAPPPGCPKAIYQLMVDCWNPLHDKRPNFSEICTYLQRPVNKLLYWSPLEPQSPQAQELGGNIEEGQELYKDVQDVYRCSEKGKLKTYF